MCSNREQGLLAAEATKSFQGRVYFGAEDRHEQVNVLIMTILFLNGTAGLGTEDPTA